MLTLNRAIALTKSFAKWSAIILGSIITLVILFKIGVFLKEMIAPTPPSPPTVSFGKLPEIEFPRNSNQTNYNYVIDTITGTLPEFPDRAKVFKIEKGEPDLLALQKASEKVAKEGFISPPIKAEGNLFQWTDPNSQIGKKIVMDIFSYEFSVTSSFYSNPSVLSGKNLSGPEAARETGENFLSNLSLLSEDIDLPKTRTSLFTIRDSSLIPATSVATAQVIKVDFFQKDLDKLPVFYPNPEDSTMDLFVGGGESFAQVIQGDFFHQNISKDSSTYPIKTADEAFEELREGKAFIASPGTGGKNVSVKEVKLGYYMGGKKQDYLMPIVVFKDGSGFAAYILAVKDEWIGK